MSYFGAQVQVARKIKEELEHAGLSVWMDEGQFGRNDVYFAAVDYGMRSSQVVVALISDAYASKPIHQKEINLCDGLRKYAISFIVTPGATFPPMGMMGPILAPHPVFDLSAADDSGFNSTFQGAFATLQSFVLNACDSCERLRRLWLLD